MTAQLRQLSPNPDRVVTIRYNLFMRIASLLGLVPFGIGVLGLLGLFPGPETPKPIYAALLVLGVYGILEFNLASISFGPAELVHRSPWRRRRTIPWSEVRGHSRSRFSSCFIIHTQQGRVRVEDSMGGREELIAFVTELLRGREHH